MGTGKARKAAAYAAAATLLVALWGGYIRGWQWTGFEENSQLWDWLTLLLLPIVLGTIPLWIRYKEYIGEGRRAIYAVALVGWTGFMIAGYLIPLKWTGFSDQKLSNWLNLLVLPVAVTTAMTLFHLGTRGAKIRLGLHQTAIIAALAAGWIVTIIGGYALHWTWTGYGEKTPNPPYLITLWDWFALLLPLVFPIILLPPLVKWVSGDAAGRARAAQEAAAAPRVTGGGVSAGEHVSRQGLWSVPGNGVLAREGDLILLSAIDERGLVEKVLDSLARSSAGGDDGRHFADAVEEVVERDETWGDGHDGQPGPAVIAIGPVGAGLTVTVSGTAWAEITTANGTERLVADQPATVLRYVIGSPVRAVRGGLGTDRGACGRTDFFSRLERGTVRAGGLSYHFGLPVVPPQGERAPEAMAPLAHDVAAPNGASRHPAAGADAPSPTAEEAAGGRKWPYPVPPPRQPYAAETPATEPETAEPEPADFEPAEPMARAPEAGAPIDVEPVAVTPAAVTPAVPLQADPVRPATGQVQVSDFRAAAVAAPPDGDTGAAADAPIVLGVYCKNGHFGDPEARSCAVCGVLRKRGGSSPQPGPRPPLGTLVLAEDSHSPLELSTDCVIGRDPMLDPSVAAGEARPLCISDARVSRIHARVHLDGWRVFLVDLDSANGTCIRAPGKRSDQALAPNVPVPLQSGTRVYVGTQCLRYEYQRDSDHATPATTPAVDHLMT